MLDIGIEDGGGHATNGLMLGSIPLVVSELMVVVFGGVLRGTEATARTPRGPRV